MHEPNVAKTWINTAAGALWTVPTPSLGDTDPPSSRRTLSLMKSAIARLAVSVLAFLGPASAAGVYNLQDNVVGNGFYDFFGVESIPDPTHGRVYACVPPVSPACTNDYSRNYVDAGTARAQNLTYANGDTFILRADYKTTLTPSGPGRNSVRLLSHKYFTRHVAV